MASETSGAAERVAELEAAIREAVSDLESFAADWGKVAGEDRIEAAIDSLRAAVSGEESSR